MPSHGSLCGDALELGYGQLSPVDSPLSRAGTRGPCFPPEYAPECGYAPPPPPSGALKRPTWAAAPATYLLVGINCAVFIGDDLSAASASATPPSQQLMKWGADNAGAVLLGGEWWRIVTAMFVHVGIMHLATNMWCLWNLALLAEPLMGSLVSSPSTFLPARPATCCLGGELDSIPRAPAGRCFPRARELPARCLASPAR